MSSLPQCGQLGILARSTTRVQASPRVESGQVWPTFGMKGCCMPSGKDISGGSGGGGKRTGGGSMSSGTSGGNKKNAYCSFCRKSYRDVGPLVEGPGDVYICGECIELCQSIIDQETRRRGVRQDRSSPTFPRRARSRTQLDAVRRSARTRPRRSSPSPSTTTTSGWCTAEERRQRRRDRQVQHPADRPDRLRQDAAGPDAGHASSTCRSPSATPPR